MRKEKCLAGCFLRPSAPHGFLLSHFSFLISKKTSIVKTAIVQYNAGNICSVINALRRIGVEPIVTSNPEEIMSADRVIFPGQGEAATTIAHLKRSGLDRVIKELRQPVLGICIGQQLLCEHSDEGDTPCLNVFEGSRVQKFVAPEGVNLKVPHTGWNTIENTSSPTVPLFSG